MTDEDLLITMAARFGARNLDTLDEAIAFCLNCPHESVLIEGFAFLQRKYYEIVQEYLTHQFPAISAAGKDLAADATFDSIWKYIHSGKKVRTCHGTLASFVNLVCEWSAWNIQRTESRRRTLLAENFQDLWCIDRDAADAYQGNAVTGQKVDDLIAAIRQAVDPSDYPHTALVLEAISVIFVGSNGWQVRGRPHRPSVASIKLYIDVHHSADSLTEDEIKTCLNVLRHRVKRVLNEHGWEIEYPRSKRVRGE